MKAFYYMNTCSLGSYGYTAIFPCEYSSTSILMICVLVCMYIIQ